MPRRFINYPTNRLLAVLDDAEAADAGIADLVALGTPRQAIERFDGADGRFATEEISLWRGPEPQIPGVWRR